MSTKLETVTTIEAVDGSGLPYDLRCGYDPNKEYNGLLVVSPYLSEPHLLDILSLSKPNQLLAKALTLLQPIRDDYATAAYSESFNWPIVMGALRKMTALEDNYRWDETFYIIVFRSQIPNTTDRSHLTHLDKLSHAEAMANRGLLKYWFGVPDLQGRNLATCESRKPCSKIFRSTLFTAVGIWRSKEDSRRGASGPGHIRAMREAIKLYSEWKVERMKLVVKEAANHWEIVEW
ncbi:hypothetical protein MMC19_001013 [Ptychographa xylographoides]|nr:hypothetical protein [Ptychographa xylographoides]